MRLFTRRAAFDGFLFQEIIQQKTFKSRAEQVEEFLLFCKKYSTQRAREFQDYLRKHQVPFCGDDVERWGRKVHLVENSRGGYEQKIRTVQGGFIRRIKLREKRKKRASEARRKTTIVADHEGRNFAS